MLKLSFSVVGSVLGFWLSALCLQPFELVTDALLFGRYIPFFFGWSAALLDFALPFGKFSVVVINYGFRLAVGCHKRLHIEIIIFFQNIGAFVKPFGAFLFCPAVSAR